MSREEDVVKTLVEMADTLLDDYDVIDVLTVLTDRCVNLIGASAAGVMLASPAGELRLVASSSETMRILELLELQAQEGPCLDAYDTGEPVAVDNLAERSDRWPTFSAAALEAGFRSVFAVPMRLRSQLVPRRSYAHGRARPHRCPGLCRPRHHQRPATSLRY